MAISFLPWFSYLFSSALRVQLKHSAHHKLFSLYFFHLSLQANLFNLKHSKSSASFLSILRLLLYKLLVKIEWLFRKPVRRDFSALCFYFCFVWTPPSLLKFTVLQPLSLLVWDLLIDFVEFSIPIPTWNLFFCQHNFGLQTSLLRTWTPNWNY